MPLRIACPTCGKRLIGPDEAAGRRVTCPKCSAVWTLPGRVESAYRACQHCGVVIREGLGGRCPCGAPLPPDVVPPYCPQYGNEITKGRPGGRRAGHEGAVPEELRAPSVCAEPPATRGDAEPDSAAPEFRQEQVVPPPIDEPGMAVPRECVEVFANDTGPERRRTGATVNLTKEVTGPPAAPKPVLRPQPPEVSRQPASAGNLIVCGGSRPPQAGDEWAGAAPMPRECHQVAPGPECEGGRREGLENVTLTPTAEPVNQSRPPEPGGPPLGPPFNGQLTQSGIIARPDPAGWLSSVGGPPGGDTPSQNSAPTVLVGDIGSGDNPPPADPTDTPPPAATHSDGSRPSDERDSDGPAGRTDAASNGGGRRVIQCCDETLPDCLTCLRCGRNSTYGTQGRSGDGVTPPDTVEVPHPPPPTASRRYEYWTMPPAPPRDWRSLRGVAFEDFLGDVFRSLGYGVKTTKGSGDQGADLIVTKADRRIAVQAKGYGKPVGNRAVQEAMAGRAYYGCSECAAITNSTFTPSAVALAERAGCLLIDGSRIPALIRGEIL